MAGESFPLLVAIMERLRGPDGCPWDREQSFATLRGYLLEECYEALEALDRDEPEALRDELGDLLFQIVFLCRLAAERGTFGVDDVIEGIRAKMIRRHPHVFGSESAATAGEVLRHWERIKSEERAASGRRPGSRLDRVPRALPALARASRLGDEAARVGFDWERPADVLHKVEEELGELRAALAAGDAAGTREELGDALFCLAMLGRRVAIDAEQALQQANAKFQARFGWMEQELARRGIDPGSLELDALEALWTRAKQELGRAERGERAPAQGAVPIRPKRRKRS